MFSYFTQEKEPEVQKQMTMRELEHVLLKLYRTSTNVKKEEAEKIFNDLVVTNFDMNSVGSSGPLFCFMLDLKPFLTLNIIKSMVDGGLDFSDVHMQGVAHKKMFRELEFKYTDTLWGIFVYLCQYSNFINTLPHYEIFDILFGKVMINKGCILTQFEPLLITIKLMLSYDKHKHRIKKAYLLERNFALRQCIKAKYPEINDEILNS